MTWLQLWKKIGKQPLRLTKYKKVVVKIQDTVYECELKYDDSGNDWYLVIKE